MKLAVENDGPNRTKSAPGSPGWDSTKNSPWELKIIFNFEDNIEFWGKFEFLGKFNLLKQFFTNIRYKK